MLSWVLTTTLRAICRAGCRPSLRAGRRVRQCDRCELRRCDGCVRLSLVKNARPDSAIGARMFTRPVGDDDKCFASRSGIRVPEGLTSQRNGNTRPAIAHGSPRARTWNDEEGHTVLIEGARPGAAARLRVDPDRDLRSLSVGPSMIACGLDARGRAPDPCIASTLIGDEGRRDSSCCGA